MLKGNIREIKGTCIRDKEKRLFLVLKKENVLNSLSDFNSLLIGMQDDIFEADIEFEILRNDSVEAIESSNVMDTLFVLEETGGLKYNVERGELDVNINGMKPVRELYYTLDILRDIKNNPKISNVFAQVGPPQDLSKKIRNEDDARKAAKTFSEGRKSLENLLYFCFNNNIKTFASCAGHEEYYGQFKDGYIAFNLEDEFTRNCIKYLNGKHSSYENYINVDEINDKIITESIYCDYETADDIFTEILTGLEEYIAKKDVIDELYKDNELNKKINTMFEHKNNSTKSKLGFLDVIEAGIELPLVQMATKFVREEVMKVPDFRECEEII